jgi:hypothetical protein
MRIGMISGHACVRVQKMAIPLLQNGHKVYLVSKGMPWGFENYDGYIHCEGINHYIEAIKILSPHVDVFHCHNEPSWFVSLVKEHSDKPAILDVHDSYLMRATSDEITAEQAKNHECYRIYTEERNNFQLADGIVYCGKTFGEGISDEYALRQPQITLPSYCPEMLFKYRGGGWIGGLVYEGKLNLQVEIDKGGRNYGFRYCVYEELMKKCKDLGISFHVYSTRKDEVFKQLYRDAFIYPPLGMPDLVERLMVHDWGLVGNVYYTREWEVAFPNKMFEYIAAQVPVVCINAKESGVFVEENELGINVSSIEELRSRWGEHERIRRALIKGRKKWAMENHIHKLEDLYRIVAKK